MTPFATGLHLFFWLVVGHALCDFPLQGDFLARAKNHRCPVPGVPPILALLAHAMIHAGAVALVTGSVELGLWELALHAVIDWMKCDDEQTHPAFAFTIDQSLHLLCKLWWVVLIFPR